ncbi:MAG: c-type cytochrome [bacterium]|nr:c-type cytochrome [bacterium]
MKNRQQFGLMLALVGALGLGTTSIAQAETESGETLFSQRTCLTCHGKDGKTPILPEYPIIAGQNAPYILQQLKDIKSGARANGNTAAMRGVMHLVNEEEMKVLADYISKLER